MVKRRGYLSYLLRLWQAGEGPAAVWRASVQEVTTGERQAFRDLDHLLAYLREQTQAATTQEEEDEDDAADARGA
jgi:hypothetical protein